MTSGSRYSGYTQYLEVTLQKSANRKLYLVDERYSEEEGGRPESVPDGELVSLCRLVRRLRPATHSPADDPHWDDDEGQREQEDLGHNSV